MVNVDLGKTVDYEILKKALIKSAEDVGLGAELKDVFEAGYKVDELGSVEKVEVYCKTYIKVSGSFLPTFCIII